jgi:hypothetical protein
MKTRSLQFLRICALVLGWVLVGSVLVSVMGQFSIYLRAQDTPPGFLAIAQFDIMKSLSTFFSGFGNALLAFLIAAVFLMIEKQAPVGSENAKRIMIVCCIAYLSDALSSFCSTILKLSELLQVLTPFVWGFWLQFMPMAIPVLVPLLYAASIFVLYTHFTKMVTFESEVA